METRQLSGARAPDIVEAARIIRSGGLVVVPTDTVYGLAAAALSAEAVERVFEAKQRPGDLRLPLLLGTAADLPIVARAIPRVAWRLIDRFWPGPLTIVLPAAAAVPGALTANGNSVGIRVPAGRTILRLLEVLGEPIVGTSANISGEASASTAADARRQLGGRIDAILAADDEVRGGLPSSVIDLSGRVPVVRRSGAVSLDQLRAVVGTRMEVAGSLTGPGANS